VGKVKSYCGKKRSFLLFPNFLPLTLALLSPREKQYFSLRESKARVFSPRKLRFRGDICSTFNFKNKLNFYVLPGIGDSGKTFNMEVRLHKLSNSKDCIV
jgi:hypothetical protein